MEYNYLESMEKLKLTYLKGFLNRTKRGVQELVIKLRELENRVRSCYSEPINYNSNDFLKMILIDASFIIEHFLRCTEEREKWEEIDPLINKTRIEHDILHDLKLIENQLPFFILEEIYNYAIPTGSFLEITFNNFAYYNKQKITPQLVVHPKHFTDLLRTFMLPSSLDSDSDLGKQVPRNVVTNVYSASQLREAGLVFEVTPSNCLLDLDFDGVVMKMPCLDVYEEVETLARNIIAFEQCHFPMTSSVTQYIRMLDFLINNEKDVDILVDKKIIVNWMGDTKAVATMINNLMADVVEYTFNFKYQHICNELNNFYENPGNKYKAILRHDYFNTPWKTASTIAAFVLLLLTLIQTICSIYSLF